MTFYSPLRYPWWKNKLSKFLAKVCIDNKINGHYVEPYAWWASVALFLLIEWFVERITINDKDRSIYAFWYSVLFETNKLISKINETEITIENRYIQKNIQKNKDNESLLDLWFSTLFLNRTNRSWIINAWPIGWKHQSWKYRINCRFNKKEIIKKIKLIAQYKDNIVLENLDALDLVSKIKKTKNTVFYFDPPYYLKWQSLYLNAYNSSDHKKVSNVIKKFKNVKRIVSYDDVEEINKLYKGYRKIQYSFKHTAYKSRVWMEILFFSDNINNIDFSLNPIMIHA